MEEIKSLLAEGINEKLYQVVFSNARNTEKCSKIKIRPVMVKDRLMYQVSSFCQEKVFHDNYEKERLVKEAYIWILEDFKQMELEGQEVRGTILVSKKGKITVKRKKNIMSPDAPNLSHNRKKKYILQEDVPVDFLIDLGVQTKDGKVVNARYDKFKQINRYLEFIEDVLPILTKDRTLHIVDFGCGKSYLTFAMYYYLHDLKGFDINVTGLDLKKDVIEHCSRLSEKYGYEKLKFVQGDIGGFNEMDKVDMVVTLHACDTATDYALLKAVQWDAEVIFSVPCCQHEVNRQIQCETLGPLLQYGLLRERMSALITDGVRARLLEQSGYETQLLEFIDMEHTPKNILIRAVKGKKISKKEKEDLEQMLEFLQISPCLHELLKDKRN